MVCHGRRWDWEPSEGGRAQRYRPVADSGSVRVSQAERDAVAAQLAKHTGDGRLTLTEFEARVEEAYSAVTRADLDRALRELPREREHQSRRAGSAGRQRGPWRPPAILVVIAVIVLASATTWWAMWLLWPGLAWAGGGCGSHHRRSTVAPGARRDVDDVIHV